MRLSTHYLKYVLDYLYDGEPGTVKALLQCEALKDPHAIYIWLSRNGIRGKKLLEFFQNESAELDGGGTLSGLNYVFKKIYKRNLTIRDLK